MQSTRLPNTTVNNMRDKIYRHPTRKTFHCPQLPIVPDNNYSNKLIYLWIDSKFHGGPSDGRLHSCRNWSQHDDNRHGIRMCFNSGLTSLENLKSRESGKHAEMLTFTCGHPSRVLCAYREVRARKGRTTGYKYRVVIVNTEKQRGVQYGEVEHYVLKWPSDFSRLRLCQ